MTQSKWVTVWETICKDPPTWPNATLIGNGTISNTGGAIEITAPNSIDGVSFNQEVMPGVWQTLNLSVSRMISGSGYVQVLEEQNGVLQSIGMQSFNHAGEIKVNFKPQTSYITWQVLGPVQTQVTQLCFDRPVLKQENVLVTICPEDKDKYRFGFNGQEKVNEWAGIGNFMEFSERGQDTRTARFITYDPLAQQFPWNSPYAFAENRPIDGIDLEGREFLWYLAETAEKTFLGTSHLKTTKDKVAEGFVGRAKQVGEGLVNLVKNPPRLATVDPGIAKRGFEADMAASQANAQTVQSAAHGNPEAIGSLLFDVGLFYASNYGAEVFTIGKTLQAESRFVVQEAKATLQETKTIVKQEAQSIVKNPASVQLVENPKTYLDKALEKQGLSEVTPRFKEEWIEGGYKYTVRAHEAEAKYGKTGTIYRVSRQKQGLGANNQGSGLEYLDPDGNWHHTSTLKPGSEVNPNPKYNHEAAKSTHISAPGN